MADLVESALAIFGVIFILCIVVWLGSFVWEVFQTLRARKHRGATGDTHESS
jgi:hypothetical protein